MKMMMLFAMFLVKHYIADFVLQTKYQYQNKGHYGKLGGILHAFIHAMGTLIVLNCFFGWFISLLGALCDGIVHYHIDWTKEQINHYFRLTSDKSGFWMILGLDQLLHQLTYLLIIIVLC